MRPKDVIPPAEFETRRLVLRAPLRSDARAIFDGYASDPGVTRYLPWTAHRSIAETREFLRRTREWRRSGREFTWAITLRRGGTLVGMIGLRVAPPKADFGYVVAPGHAGNGYATEAARTLCEWALAEGSIHRVWALVDTRKAASARVLEKAGMTREGTLRNWGFHGGELIDCHAYARLKEHA